MPPIRDWALQCFQHRLFNLINAEQKRLIYQAFGLDWQWVRGVVMEVFGDAEPAPPDARVDELLPRAVHLSGCRHLWL